MNSIEKARHVFDERFYRWAIADWKREINEGFPFIKLLDEREKRLTLKIMENFDSREEQLIFAKSMVKRITPEDVVKRCNDEFTDKERQYAQLYLNIVTNATMGLIDIGEFEIHERFQEGPKLNRRRLRQRIIEVLTPIYGKEYEDLGGGEWRYHSQIGPWQVKTHIDTGGQYHQICYHHNIIAREHVYLKENISLFLWYGIGSQTDWKFLIEDDTELVANALARFCEHFMNAIPKLLEGLAPNE